MLICQKCGVSRTREDKNLDILLQVKGFSGVYESLLNCFEMIQIEGVDCDNCAEKTTTLKGMRIKGLPPVLTVCLARFDLDYTTFQRVKLNDKFEFPLEVNLTEFLDPEAILESPDDAIYELKSIIIHRGGAYGGHYHAYIQDELNEGQWHLEMPKEFQKEPKLLTKVAYNPKDFMTDEQIKKMEDDLKNDNEAGGLSIQTEEAQTKTEQQIAAEQSTKKKKGKN